MNTADHLPLPQIFENLLNPALKEQLRAIGGRVRDLVLLAVTEARAALPGLARLAPLVEAHASAIAIFESECLGYFHNVPGGLELQRALACKPGCTFCCELKIEITILEAVAIWRDLSDDSHAGQRAAVAEVAPRIATLNTEARRMARITCPLLAEGMCTVHDRRPYACRGLFSMDAAGCERALTAPAGVKVPPIRSPAVPRALSAAFGAGVNAALARAGLQHDILELSSALATLIARPTAADDWLSGKNVFDLPVLD